VIRSTAAAATAFLFIAAMAPLALLAVPAVAGLQSGLILN
jgi:hypothetical protein